MKVVWLCNFANNEMNIHFKTLHVRELASWINNLIELFREQSDIELHIVAPNIFTNIDCSFIERGVYYHFYAFRLKLIPKKVNTLIKILFGTNYTCIQSKICKIIGEIQPEIIHLHGAENPYYSAGIIPLIGKYPVMLTIQGFIRNSSSKTKKIKKDIKIEEEIIRNVIHFGVRSKEMNEIILSLNPKARLYFHNYPLTIPKYVKNNGSSSFDIVFFARVHKDKGIEDLLQALVLIKKKKNDISLHIIGPIGQIYKQHLLSMIKSMKIESNVVWIGFMENQQDIFKYSVNAKICVLPTYHDILPGTIIESMLMKLPVISYAVGGIPGLNENECTVILVEKQNINQLAEKILQLLKNPDLRKSLAEKAFYYAHERFNNDNVVPDIVNAYRSILKENNIL
jgi:glycosyltransferase involved in cell wall biosynthesis